MASSSLQLVRILIPGIFFIKFVLIIIILKSYIAHVSTNEVLQALAVYIIQTFRKIGY